MYKKHGAFNLDTVLVTSSWTSCLPHQKHLRCSNLCFSNVHGPGVLVENVKPQTLVQKQNDVKFVPKNDRKNTFILFFSFRTHPCGPEGPQELNGCAQRGPGVDNWWQGTFKSRQLLSNWCPNCLTRCGLPSRVVCPHKAAQACTNGYPGFENRGQCLHTSDPS